LFHAQLGIAVQRSMAYRRPIREDKLGLLFLLSTQDPMESPMLTPFNTGLLSTQGPILSPVLLPFKV